MQMKNDMIHVPSIVIRHQVFVLTAGKESLYSYRCGTRGIVVM